MNQKLNKYYICALAIIFLIHFAAQAQQPEKKNSYEYTFLSDDIDIRVREKRIGDSLEVTIKFTNYKTVPIYIDTLYADTGSGKIIGTDIIAWTIDFFKLTHSFGNYNRYWYLHKIMPNQSFTYSCNISGATKYQSFTFGYFENLKLLKRAYTVEGNSIKVNIGKYYDATELDVGQFYEIGKKSIQKLITYDIMVE